MLRDKVLMSKFTVHFIEFQDANNNFLQSMSCMELATCKHPKNKQY